jgi:tetratricopeptide (TPR) repeat protein
VSAAFLAASAAVSGSAAATPAANAELASEAYKALQAGDAAGAIASYSAAIESRELEPEVLANALLNRGLAYQRLNQHDLAIDDYTAAMRIDAMSAKLRAMALYNRGVSYQKLQMNSRAMEDFTSALFLDQGFAHAYYSRGALLRDTGQYLFALSDFEKAIQFNYPEPARVYFGEAQAYEALGRTDNERQALAQALAVNPHYVPAQTRLAALNGVTPAPAANADEMITASIASPGNTLTARKQALPEAAAPSAELLGNDQVPADEPMIVKPIAATAHKKTITDRVLPEEKPVTIAAAADTSPDEPAPTEKVIAVEAVPDAPVADAEADQTAASDQAEVEKGWSVQVASAGTEEAAWATWKKMQAGHRVLAGKTPIVVKADLGAKGTFYRVRFTGFESQNVAKSACSRLKSGGVQCFISKASS